MSTDLTRKIELPAIVTIPNDQGELVEYDTTNPVDMVKVRTIAVAYSDDAYAWKKLAEEALRQYADATLQLRFTAGSHKVSVDKPDADTLVWDEQVLLELEHVLDRDQYLELCRPEYKLNPRSVQLQALARNYPDSAAGEIIRRAETRKAKASRGVRVERA